MAINKLLNSGRVDCYCAFCKNPRRVYTKRSVSSFHVLFSFVGAMVMTYWIYQEFDPRGILMFVFFLSICEMFLQIRWRLTVVCRNCGFDPILYVKEPMKAAAKVKDFIDQRRQNPAYILAPTVRLPKITKERKEELMREEALAQRKTGSIISRQI